MERMLQEVGIDVLEILNSQKLFRLPDHSWGEIKNVSKSYLHVPIFFHFVLHPPL